MLNTENPVCGKLPFVIIQSRVLDLAEEMHLKQGTRKEGQIKAQIPLLLFSRSVLSTLCDPRTAGGLLLSPEFDQIHVRYSKVIQI